MTTEAIKKEFHELIDKVENPLLLEQFYKALSFSQDNSSFELWDSLTEIQRNEILTSYEESKDDKNLISYEEFQDKHKKWLSK